MPESSSTRRGSGEFLSRLPTFTRWGSVRCGLGLAFLATAALKAEQLASQSAHDSVFSKSPLLLLVATELELGLGAWLLSGFSPRRCWVAKMTFLVALLAIAAILAATGTSTCGCLGHVRAPPSVMLALDAAALCMLLIGRPARVAAAASTGCAPTRSLPGDLKYIIVPAVIFALSGVAAIALAFGSLSAARSWLRGDRLSMTCVSPDLGDVKQDEIRRIALEITNRGNRPVTVLGGGADSSCVLAEGLPLTPEKRPEYMRISALKACKAAFHGA